MNIIGKHTYTTGRCVHCGETATKEALFHGDGITIVENYCDGCLQTEKFSALMTFYEGC